MSQKLSLDHLNAIVLKLPSLVSNDTLHTSVSPDRGNGNASMWNSYYLTNFKRGKKMEVELKIFPDPTRTNSQPLL